MHIITHKNKKYFIKKRSFIKLIKTIIFYLLTIIIIYLFLFFSKSLLFKKLNIIKKNKNELINNYLLTIPSKYEKEKRIERKRLEYFLSLQLLKKNTKDSFYLEIKKMLLNKFINNRRKIIKKINIIYLKQLANFGNTMQMLNNFIYYCEILECKNIYLNDNWFIKRKITLGNINIDIKKKTEINCTEINTLCFSLWKQFCLYPMVIKPEIRINLLKNEIHQNLPKIKINPDTLYIFIRSGDIFQHCKNPYFPQPPLCFYIKILDTFKFNNIRLISKTNNNPVINKLLAKYPNIIFIKRFLKYDLACLMNAFNLVGATSSMLHASLILNENLKNYWEYDIYRYSEKFGHLHFDIYKYPNNFKIFRMNPSINYKNEFFAWKNTPEQLKLMIEEECPNNFNVCEIKDL